MLQVSKQIVLMMEFLQSHTVLLVIITSLVSIAAWKHPPLLHRLIMWPPVVRQRGQYDRLITHGFVHGDGWHLLFNMVTLFFFGRAIEEFYRPYLAGMGFALFYVSAIVVAILPSYLKHKNDIRYLSLGASGAVSAVLFAYILFAPWSLIFVFFIPMPAIVYAILYTAYTLYAQRRGNDGINHSAHLWGAAYGLVVTIAIEPSILLHFAHHLMNPRLPFFN